MTTWSPIPDTAPNTTITPTGRINRTNQSLGLTQGGADYDTKYGTYLKLFSGEMFKAYESACIAKETVQNRTLTSGRSMQFIFTGRMTAEYHQPGEPILGTGAPPVAEKTIIMDDLLISVLLFTSWMKLWLTILCVLRSLPRSATLWLRLMTRKSSVRSLRPHVKHTRLLPLLAPSPAVLSSVWVITMSTMLKLWLMLSLKQLLFLMKRTCPKSGRHAVLNPRQYYALISQVDTNILNKDYGTTTQGSLNTGEGLYSIAGISIKRSNNLPFMVRGTGTNDVIERVDGENNDYGGDFTNHAGLIYQKDAAAVVQALGPQVQTTGADVKTMYQGDIIVGRLAMGAGTLNPAAAIELQAAD